MTSESRLFRWSERLQLAWLSRGPLARSLLPLSILFAALAGLQRAAYRSGLAARHRVGVPVVVVGNLIAGGAGKTPTVMAIVELLRRHGYTPGIVSRGYGAGGDASMDVDRALRASVCGDEPLMMHLRTGAPVVVGRRRVAAAQHLRRRHPDVNVVISDDGLQHLALERDVQVLVFDERGAGNRWLLPAGPLREALPRATPPRTLVLYNAASPSTPLPGTLARRQLTGAVALPDWWQGHAASAATLESLKGRTLVAAAGVARPQRFFEMLQRQGLTIVPLPLPDHFDYASLPWPPGTADVVLTEKDAIKIEANRLGATRVWVAPLDFTLDPAFESALIELLPPPRSPHGNTPAQPARLPDL